MIFKMHCAKTKVWLVIQVVSDKICMNKSGGWNQTRLWDCQAIIWLIRLRRRLREQQLTLRNESNADSEIPV